MTYRTILASSWIFAAGCAGTGQPEVSYEAYASPAPPREIEAGGWTVTLDEAIVAFGPLALCASASGSPTLCETAIGEIAAVARFDGLDPTPQPLGTVRGFAGEVRSASFDYGIHWFATETSPAPNPDAPGVDSARFHGRATRGGESLDFTAHVDVLAQSQGQRAVSSVPAEGTVTEATARLDVRFDVPAWFQGVDFDNLAAAGPGPIVIEPGSSAHTALVIAMVNQGKPEIIWSESP